MNEPAKNIKKLHSPLVEQAINAANWDKTSTWETLASKTASESCKQQDSTGKKEKK